MPPAPRRPMTRNRSPAPSENSSGSGLSFCRISVLFKATYQPRMLARDSGGARLLGGFAATIATGDGAGAGGARREANALTRGATGAIEAFADVAGEPALRGVSMHIARDGNRE